MSRETISQSKPSNADKPNTAPGARGVVTLSYGCPTNPPDCTVSNDNGASVDPEPRLGPASGGDRPAADVDATACHLAFQITAGANADLPPFDIVVTRGSNVDIPVSTLPIPRIPKGTTRTYNLGFSISGPTRARTVATLTINYGAPFADATRVMTITLT